jgi:hypothetical protein
MAYGLPVLPPAIELRDEDGNCLRFFTAEQMMDYGITCYMASLAETHPPVAWLTTQTLDSSHQLDLGVITTNPAYVAINKQWKWISLYASRIDTE